MKRIYYYFKVLGKNYVISMVIFITIIHFFSVYKKSYHIEKFVIGMASKNASNIELALEEKNVFKLKKILNNIKSDQVDFLAFKSKKEGMNWGPSVYIGKVFFSSLLKRSYRFEIIINEHSLGIINFSINILPLFFNVFFDNIILYFLSLLFMAGLVLYSNLKILKALQMIDNSLEEMAIISPLDNLQQSREVIKSKMLMIPETGPTKSFSFLLSKLMESIQQLIKIENSLSTAKAKSEMASQVAHDIRSPLSALYAIMEDIKILPETTRLILRSSIQRIQDIANNLSSKNNRKIIVGPEETSIQLLSGCIDEIISEKRASFRSQLGVTIERVSDASSYGLFARINLVELKRILSNVINNSVEAFEDNKGVVTLHLKDLNEKEKVEIIIEDNGKGIPEKIIGKLGLRGASFGKENHQSSGSGLGLFHAQKTLEAWKGGIEIKSKVGVGTKIILTLEKERPPDWFVSNLTIKEKSVIAILDDDEGIHQIWDKKLEECKFPKSQTINFSSPHEFSTWVKEKSQNYKDILYLCDFELIGFEVTGLDLIEEFSLGTNAVLVTSHFEEEDIQKRCKNSGIKLIPKMLVGDVPLVLISERDIHGLDEKTEIKKEVLLDDDPLVCMVWQLKAAEKGVNLDIFERKEELYQNKESFTKDTIFYIDSNLSDQQKGEDIALELFKEGYENLYLATGYEANFFKEHTYLKGVIGKEPPWA